MTEVYRKARFEHIFNHSELHSKIFCFLLFIRLFKNLKKYLNDERVYYVHEYLVKITKEE